MIFDWVSTGVSAFRSHSLVALSGIALLNILELCLLFKAGHYIHLYHTLYDADKITVNWGTFDNRATCIIAKIFHQFYLKNNSINTKKHNKQI